MKRRSSEKNPDYAFSVCYNICLFSEQLVQCFPILIFPLNPAVCATVEYEHSSRAGGCKGNGYTQLVFAANDGNIPILNIGSITNYGNMVFGSVSHISAILSALLRFPSSCRVT